MQNKSLIWAYPPNNWKSNSNKTFVYGWSNPKLKLFISVNDEVPKKVKVFPNGNFAKSINLSQNVNHIKLVQSLNKKKKIMKRAVKRKKQADHKYHKTIRSSSSQLSSHTKPALSPVIVIDPGHGGKEHGTHSPKGIPESKYNLQIAKLLYKKLKRKNTNVYLTRTKDKFVSLNKRVLFAKRKKCNILISIHHNALPDNEDPIEHRGVEVYYFHQHSKKLAENILNEISKETKLTKRGAIKRNFALTRPGFCRAVLIECGFLIHPTESEFLIQFKSQNKIAEGILKGIFDN